MKSKTLKISLFVIILLGVVGYLAFNNINYFQTKRGEGSKMPSEWKTYRNNAVGLEFKYPSKYYLEEKSGNDPLRKKYSVILTEDTEENRLVREGKSPGREGPVFIGIDAYQNFPNRETAIEWVKDNPDSNFKLSNGTYSEVFIAGEPAISYHWSGLYEADNLVFTNSAWIISAYVNYIDPNDDIKKDFPEIINTLRF